jgi:hypothetical protein
MYDVMNRRQMIVKFKPEFLDNVKLWRLSEQQKRTVCHDWLAVHSVHPINVTLWMPLTYIRNMSPKSAARMTCVTRRGVEKKQNQNPDILSKKQCRGPNKHGKYGRNCVDKHVCPFGFGVSYTTIIGMTKNFVLIKRALSFLVWFWTV